MGKSSPPPAPDYVGAANATSAGNKEAAIASQIGNMVNQITPQGTVTYSKIGEEKGVPRWQQTVALSPEQQAAYQKDVAMNARLQDVGMQGVGYVQSALNQPLQPPGQAVSTTGTTQFTTGVNAPTLNTAGGNLGGMTRGIGEPTIGLATGAWAGGIQSGVENTGQIQTNLTPTTQGTIGSVYNPNLQTVFAGGGNIRSDVGNPELVQQQVTDALYKQQTAMLDPQFARSQAALETQLANQGITLGSEAWNEEMRKANLNKQQAYESARQSAIVQGVNAAQGMFGMNLQGIQSANAAQQQAYGQSLGQAQFANQAARQQFEQGLAGANLANALQAQQFTQNQAQQQAYNQAIAQQFSQGLQGAQFANAAQQQAYQQRLSNAQIQNQARAQQLQEAISTGQFANAAQAQAYAQELQNIQAQNAAMTQQFGFGLSNAGLANQAANQQYAQQLSNAQLANQAMQQNFANAQTLQQQPINILNAVRTGSQMQTAAQPQAGVSSPGNLATWAGPDLLGAASAQGQYDQGVYNAKMAQQNALMSGLFSLGSAGMMKYSDPRTKENVIKIGRMDNGLDIYAFDYKPEFKEEAGHGRYIGHMADEVEALFPAAVSTDANGYKMVNYGVIYG